MKSKNTPLSRSVEALLLCCLFVIVCFCAVHVQTVRASTDQWHAQNTLLPSSSVNSSLYNPLASLPSAPYDEQLWSTFDQGSASFSYNVTAIAQTDAYGYGPAYLLNGLSNGNYWYQVGLAYNWPYEGGGYNSGFYFIYEVWNSAEESVYPTDGGGGLQSFSGPVNSGDLVQLSLHINGGVVHMTAYDWNTTATCSVSYGSVHPTTFIAGTMGGFFTGLMTEWYHVNPYSGGESAVNYTDFSSGISSGWMGMDEWEPGQTWTGQWTYLTSLLTYSSNPNSLQDFSNNGATESSDAYQFTTGLAPEATSITLLPADASNPLPAGDSFEVAYILYGQQVVTSAQSGTLIVNADVGSNVVISVVSADSSSPEEWALNSQGGSLDVLAGSTSTWYYYDLLSQIVSYSVDGSGSISPQIFYNTAPSTASSQPNPTSSSMSIPDSGQQIIWALKGAPVSVTNDMLGAVQDQWATPTSSWTISQADQVFATITYYHQYQVTANYTTSDNSGSTSAPYLLGTQLGSPCQLPLTNTSQATWLDQNTSWTTSTVATAPSGTEQWVCSTGNSGTITQATSINPTYEHQYYLTVISPSPANVVTSGSGWYNAGSTAYAGLGSGTVSYGTGARWEFAGWTTGGNSYQQSNAITMNSAVASAAVWDLQYYLNVSSAFGSPIGGGWYNAGSSANFGVTTPFSGGVGVQYLFNSWSGLGDGSCNGSVVSNSVTINNPIVESANWTTQYYLSVNDNGIGATAGSGWYDSGSSTQAAVSANVVSGAAGSQFVFSGWIGDASGSGSTSSNIAINSPETAIATWTTQYQVTFIITPSYGGLTTPIGVDLWVDSGSLSIHALPDSGYTFSSWTSNTASITFDNSNAISTVANVNGPGVITASLVQASIATSQPTPITGASPVRPSSPSPIRTSTATSNVSPASTDSPKPAPEFPDLSVILMLLFVVSLCTMIMVSARKQAVPRVSDKVLYIQP